MLTDVLRGSENKRILDSGLSQLPLYGKLSEFSREDVTSIIEWLIENHFILKTNHPKYPVLHPTYEGMHYNEVITVNKLRRLQKFLEERED